MRTSQSYPPRSVGQPAALDEQVRALLALGLLLGGGGGGGDLVVAGEGSGRGLHRPDGQADQGMDHQPALAVLARVAALGLLLGAEEAALADLEMVQQILAAPLPVRAAEDHQEVVAADVADEVQVGVADRFQQLARSSGSPRRPGRSRGRRCRA